MNKFHKNRTGYTLIELLTAMAVIAVLAGMMMAAMNAAEKDARRVRAQSQIDRINAMVNEVYDREARRRFSIGSPGAGFGFTNPTQMAGGGGSNVAQQHTAGVRGQLNRARLKLLRDWLRVSMPDRKTDLQDGIATIAVQTFDQSSGSTTSPMTVDFPNSMRLARLTRFQNQVFALTKAKIQGDPNPTNPPPANATQALSDTYWTPQFQDAECLYLILSASTVSSGSALESIRESEIGDLDNDGMPEILDPWGNPIGYMRWPAGYWLAYESRMETNANVRPIILNAQVNSLGPDGIDLLRSDYRFFSGPTSLPTTIDDPFNIRPIVFSAGSDGVFDLCTRWRSGPASNYVHYATMTYTNGNNTEIYPDPYMGGPLGNASNTINYTTTPSVAYTGGTTTDTPFDQALRDGLVGAYYDENEDQFDNSVDNIFP